MHLISLLFQDITVLTKDGTPVVIPPSGPAAQVIEDFEPAEGDVSVSADGTGPYLRLRRPVSHTPRVRGLPDVPGRYIVSAQVAEAVVRDPDFLPQGMELYTPGLLLMPGQPGHPGRDIKGPVAPYLIRRWPLPTGTPGRSRNPYEAGR